MAFSIGIVFGNLRLLPEFSGQELWRGIIGQEITITGIIADDPNLAQGTYKFKLKQLQIDQEKSQGKFMYNCLRTDLVLNGQMKSQFLAKPERDLALILPVFIDPD